MIDSAPQSPLRGHRARWRLQPRLPEDIRAALNGGSVMLAHLLYCRGFRTAEEIRAFHEGRSVSHDPFLMPDMAAAIERIVLARERGERVAVYGDFDCDGVTAAAVMLDTLRAIGLDPPVHIPERADGHGLHPESLAALRDRGVALIVTADCGITAIDEVQVAHGLGMDVVITDHHEPRPDGLLPDCPVVAPTRLYSEYPFRSLCGAGVVYKLAQGLASRLPGTFDPTDLLDLVALGTVADVVPLLDENRSLVISGLKRLRETERPGLLALFSAAGVQREAIDPVSISFYLAPRINAANRLASPRLAFELLTATDRDEAGRLAAHLSDLNRQRQDIVQTMVAMLLAEFGDPIAFTEAVERKERAPVLVSLGDWPAGISGLLASKLVEAYGVPAFVGTRDGSVIVVSARGTPHSRIDELLERCETSQPAGLFLGYGGHSRAGGFRIEADRWPEVLLLLEEEARRSGDEHLGAALEVDAEVALRQLTFEAGRQVRSLAPFGMDFPEPLFLARNVVLKSSRALSDGKHARVRLEQRASTATAVFFHAPAAFIALPPGTHIDVLFHLSLNEWNGRVSIEPQIRDWRLSG